MESNNQNTLDSEERLNKYLKIASILLITLIVSILVYDLRNIRENGYFLEKNYHTFKDNTFTAYVHGYETSCFSESEIKLYTKANASWNLVTAREMPRPSYLGDVFYDNNQREQNSFGCDLVFCEKITRPYSLSISDYGYRKIGEKDAPKNPKDSASNLLGDTLNSSKWKIPVYEKIPIIGTLKIEIPYYTDSKCSIPFKKTYSATIEK